MTAQIILLSAIAFLTSILLALSLFQVLYLRTRIAAFRSAKGADQVAALENRVEQELADNGDPAPEPLGADQKADELFTKSAEIIEQLKEFTTSKINEIRHKATRSKFQRMPRYNYAPIVRRLAEEDHLQPRLARSVALAFDTWASYRTRRRAMTAEAFNRIQDGAKAAGI